MKWIYTDEWRNSGSYLSGPHLPHDPHRRLLGGTSELNIRSQYAFYQTLENLDLNPVCKVA